MAVQNELEFAGWMDTKTLSAYACAGEKTIRAWVHSPVDPLPASQRGGKIRVNRRVFDAWMERQPVRTENIDAGAIAADIIASVREAR